MTQRTVQRLAEPVERPAPTSSAPSIGQHLATLNLFRETDGTIWMTVADARGAIAEAHIRLDQTNLPQLPMRILAEWVREAANRFVKSWSSYNGTKSGR